MAETDLATFLFFEGHRDALDLYLTLENRLTTSFPDVTRSVQKTQITFRIPGSLPASPLQGAGARRSCPRAGWSSLWDILCIRTKAPPLRVLPKAIIPRIYFRTFSEKSKENLCFFLFFC